MAGDDRDGWDFKALTLMGVMVWVAFIVVVGVATRADSLSYPGLAAFMLLLAGTVLWLYMRRSR